MIRPKAEVRFTRAVVVALGTLVALGCGLASCRDVVSGTSLNATQALCSTLQDCYGQDAFSCPELDLAVTNAKDEDVKPFLAGFLGNECSDTCSGALACLDNPVFCAPAEEVCARTENCCGWSEGLTGCKEGACCKNDGVRCDDSGDCCEQNCIAGFCGGYECFLLEAPCTFDAECCTSNCGESGLCERSGCTQLGQPCISQSECCQFPVSEEGEEVPTAICIAKDGATQSTCELITEEECLLTQQPCALPPAPGSTPCCDGLECRQSLDSQFAFCVEPGGCNPTGFDCAVDADCCSLEAVCVLGPTVSICVENLACTKAGQPCDENGECCSGECAAGICQQGSGVVCASVEQSCHSPLQTGPVITDDETCSYLPDVCLSAVLDADVFCRCNSWDTTCVNRYDNCSNPAP